MGIWIPGVFAPEVGVAYPVEYSLVKGDPNDGPPTEDAELRDMQEMEPLPTPR